VHEMRTIVTDESICPSVCQSVMRLNSALGFTLQGSFSAAFTKSLWPLFHLVLGVSTSAVCCLETLFPDMIDPPCVDCMQNPTYFL